MRRKTKAQTPQEILEAAEQEARRVLERAEDQAEGVAQALDAAELRDRVAARTEEIREAAAGAARAAIEARAHADRLTAEAVRSEATAAELESEIATREVLLREHHETIESLTVRGQLDQAVQLERGLSEFDVSDLHDKLASARAAERAARDRAGSARALASRLSDEAAEARGQLERVEQDLEPEFDERRRARAMERAARLLFFDQRALSFAVAVQAEARLMEESASAVDSANATWPDGTVIEVDSDRRVHGVHLPITTKS